MSIPQSMTTSQFIIFILVLIGVFISFISLYFYISLLIIYIKKGKFDIIKRYKTYLIVICFLLSLCNLDFYNLLTQKFIYACLVEGLIKVFANISLETIQVTLIFINIFSFQHSEFLEKNKKCFAIRVFFFCWIPVILTLISEIIETFKQHSIQYDQFNYCYQLQYKVFFFIFVIFQFRLLLLVKSEIKNKIDVQAYKKYKQKLFMYFIGMLLSFPYIVIIILLLTASIFGVQDSFAIQITSSILYLIYTELSPTFTVIAYCMKKSHWNFVFSCILCKFCKKDNNIRLSSSTENTDMSFSLLDQNNEDDSMQLMIN